MQDLRRSSLRQVLRAKDGGRLHISVIGARLLAGRPLSGPTCPVPSKAGLCSVGSEPRTAQARDEGQHGRAKACLPLAPHHTRSSDPQSQLGSRCHSSGPRPWQTHKWQSLQLPMLASFGCSLYKSLFALLKLNSQSMIVVVSGAWGVE